MTDEEIKFAGDVIIEQAVIINSKGFGESILNQIYAIEIYEDMFSPFISGVISVRESLDYINIFPLVGEEVINLKIKTPNFDGEFEQIKAQFSIYKITNRILRNERNVVYEIHFISKEAIVDLNKKISKSFEGKVSDIARTLLSDIQNGLETPKKLNIEKTPNGIKYVSNFWSPVKNLNYLIENAKNDRDIPSYLFFENRFGFNFLSLESLYDLDIRQEFSYDGFYRDFTSGGKSKRNIEKEYKRIVNIEIPVLYDYMNKAMNGMYASKKITHDILTKKYKVNNFDMLTDFAKQKHLNTYPLVSPNHIRRPNQFIMNSASYWGNFNGYRDITNSISSQLRLSLMEQALANKVIITVPGRTDYTVGDKIRLNLKKINPIKKEEEANEDIDAIFSGNYLINSINHFITRERHECIMEVIKDSYIKEIGT